MNTAKPRYILAVDPGSKQSAWLLYDLQVNKPTRFGLEPNDMVCAQIQNETLGNTCFIIEGYQNMGMPLGRDAFETLIWIGKMESAWNHGWTTDETSSRIYRREVQLHMCGTTRATMTNIRHAVAGRYGGSLKAAKGTKKKHGPLYGIGGDDLWSALAIAVTWAETHDAAG